MVSCIGTYSNSNIFFLDLNPQGYDTQLYLMLVELFELYKTTQVQYSSMQKKNLHTEIGDYFLMLNYENL